MVGTDRNAPCHARLTELEDLIVQLDCTFADLATARRKEYFARDLKRLRDEADRIHAKRREA